MSDACSSKRTITTLSPQFVKRVKTEHFHDRNSSSPGPVPLTANHGVERIPLRPSDRVHSTSPQYLEQIARERIETLSGQGRRAVGRPLVMDDGIVIHWVSVESSSETVSKASEETSAYFVKDDLNLQPVAAVLATHTHQSTSKGERGKQIIRFPNPLVSASGSNQADAIIIDEDEGETRNDVKDSESDIEFVSWTRRGLCHDKVEDQDDVRSPFLATSHSYRSTSKVRSPRVPTLRPPRAGTSDTDSIASDYDHVADDDADAVGVKSVVDTLSPKDSSVLDFMEVSAGSEVNPREASPLPPVSSSIQDLSEHREPQPGSLANHQGSLPPQKRPIKRSPPLSKRRSLPEPVHCIDDGGTDDQVQLKRVPLPKTPYGRSRRLLMPTSSDLPFVAITMRGDCHFIHRKDKFRISLLSLPNPGVVRRVDDACIVGDTVVLGYDSGPHQISFLPVTHRKPNMVDVALSPHSSGLRYKDTPRRGVKCLAAMHAEAGRIKFFSGGHDGTIHRWAVSPDALHDPHSEKVTSHGNCLSALAYRHQHASLLSSTQKTLFVTDLNRGQTVFNHSNEINQIHVHPQAPYVTLLEVRHLDRQVLLYDSRKANYNKEPCLSFGHRNSDSKFSPSHNKGSVHLVHFARGNEDGSVLLWDFRNCKEAVVVRRYQHDKVVHTIFAESDIATLGQGVVTFFNNYLVA